MRLFCAFRASSTIPRRGIALVWVVVAMMLLMAAIVAAHSASERARDTIENELQFGGQTLNIARAGIADALSWFRRQTAQPVTAFAPQRNLAAVPPINDTDDPVIGLVRSIEVSEMDGVWARYEVRIDRLQDISAARGQPGAGIVWQIESIGYLYRNANPALAFNQFPNEVLSRVRLQTEIQRLAITPPAQAAVCAFRASGVNFNNRTKVLGGIARGLVYLSGTGVATITGTLQGSPSGQAGVSPYLQFTNPPVPPVGTNPHPACIRNIFGITDAELRATADIYTTDPNTITSPLPDYRIVYVDGNITFTTLRPLQGTAILIVNGNLTVAASSNSVFNGLLYVTGQCQILAPTLIRGVVVGHQNVQLIGAGDFVEVDYDPGVLDDLRQRLGQYRYAKPTRVVE